MYLPAGNESMTALMCKQRRKKGRKGYFPEKTNSCSLEEPPSAALTGTAKPTLERDLREVFFLRMFGGIFLVLLFLTQSHGLISRR